jgi:hypothetical protein
MPKKPTSITKSSSTPKPPNITLLLKELTAPSKESRSHALRTLVTLGSPIREVLATPDVVVYDGVYCTSEIVALIDEIGPSHPEVYAGLAKAVTGPGMSVRRVAIFICTEIKSPPVVILKAIVTALLYDWRDDIRGYAALSLGKIRSAAPVVLSGLATALQEYEPTVLGEVMRTIDLIGVPSPELLAGVGHFLYRPSGTFCERALSIIETFNTFDPALIAAISRSSTITRFTPPTQTVRNSLDVTANLLRSY